MKKLLFLFQFVLITSLSFGDGNPEPPKSPVVVSKNYGFGAYGWGFGSVSTVPDRWIRENVFNETSKIGKFRATNTFYLPVYTTPSLKGGKDSMAAMMYVATTNQKAVYVYNGVAWKKIPTINEVDSMISASSLDTTYLSNRIDARVKYTDTAAMLAPYLKESEAVTSYWGTSGNVFSNSRFLGTTNNRGFGERTNNIEYRYLDTLGKSYFNKTLISYLGSERLELSNGGNNLSPYSLAIGSNCLRSQTGSTSSNTMIGFRAGQSITSGDGNAGLGFQVLRLATTATNNLGVGKSALQLLVTGKANTAIGANSGISILGNGNTVLGAFAANSLKDSLNVIIGGGGDNFFLGAGGYGNGSYNVYVGAKSASTVFQATPHNLRKNTFIGYNTGSSCRGGDSNNIAIGYNVTLFNGARNRLSIGNVIYGTGIGIGGRIGINKLDPNFATEINGTFGVNRDSLPSATNNDSLIMIGGNNQAKKRPVSGLASYVNSQGIVYSQAQLDKTDATLADIPNLTYTVAAAGVYVFKAKLYVDADVVGGQKYAIGGTATATSIKYQINALSNTTNVYVITSRQTALAGSAGQAGSTSNYVEIDGTIVVNAAGTLTVQFAQNAPSGTSSVLTLSSFEVKPSN